MSFSKDIKKYFYQLFLTLIGCIIMACSTSFFLLPSQLSSGGFSGIATVFYYFFNIPLGLTVIILNIPLFVVSYFKLGKKFFFKAIFGTIVLSIFLDLFDKFKPLTQDKVLASIYGGIIMGLGTSIILKAEGSTGGTDLLSYIIRAFKPQYRPSILIVVVDVFIVGLNVICFRDVEVGLYSAITIYLMGKIIDIVFEGVYFTKMIYIISDKYKEISEEIENNVKRGTTGIYAKGMYSNDEKLMLLCVGSRSDIAQIKQIVRKLDNHAFVIITNAREAVGNGFKTG